ncbi:MAG: amidohydrolase family protein [Terracidiphilus sp.]
MFVCAKDTPHRNEFKFPHGSCDAHCHVFGPSDRFPYPAEAPYRPADSPKESLVAMHRRFGIDRMVIVHPSAHGTDHAVTLDAIADDPENRRGVGILDRTFTEEKVQTLHAGGFRGARFSFLKHLGGGPDADTFERVVDLIAPFGWHLVLHVTGEDLLANFKKFSALRLPIVIDHMARVNASRGVNQPAMQCLLELARQQNCWVKVSGGSRIAAPPYQDAVPIAQAILEAAPERCLWGTDFPHPNSRYHATEEELVSLIPLYAPDAALQYRLLVSNPARLYGFPPVHPGA